VSEVLLISTSYPDRKDGSEAAGSFVEDFALELANTLPVTVVAPGHDNRLTREGPITISRFKTPLLPLSLLRAGNPGHWPAIIRTLRAGQHAVEQIVTDRDISHTLALWALPSGLWARQAFRRHGIPYSVWALGSDIWSLGKLPIIRDVLAHIIRDSAHAYADGLQLCDDVTALSGKSCLFLPSTRRLSPPSKEPTLHAPYRLAFLGRWHPNKGVDLLLDSLDHLSEETWQLIREINIYGGGPLEAQVRSGCLRLAGQGRPVYGHGYLDRNAAADTLAHSDYLLLPSRIESIPVVFSDALQTLCPIAAMPVGDLPRLLRDYGVGELADELSATAFAQAITALLKTPPAHYRDALSRAAKDFDLTTATQTFLGKAGLLMDAAS